MPFSHHQPGRTHEVRVECGLTKLKVAATNLRVRKNSSLFPSFFLSFSPSRTRQNALTNLSLGKKVPWEESKQ